MNKNTLQKRPVYLNLLKIRQPVTALASIAHRISGVFLFLSIPCLIWLLDQSLTSEASYETVIAQLASPVSKLLLIALAWSAAHHFFAGIRFLFLDVDVGVELAAARRSALIVNVLGALVALMAMVAVL